MQGDAIIDSTGVYRYRLTRLWAPERKSRCVFVMLNPSTADASEDDPTIRRCLGFAHALGHGELDVVNLFALRATDPAELEQHRAPVGPDNDKTIREVATGAARVVAAWGVHRFARGRSVDVIEALTALGDVYALKLTKKGAPAHPLFLPAALEPVLFRRGRGHR